MTPPVGNIYCCIVQSNFFSSYKNTHVLYKPICNKGLYMCGLKNYETSFTNCPSRIRPILKQHSFSTKTSQKKTSKKIQYTEQHKQAICIVSVCVCLYAFTKCAHGKEDGRGYPLKGPINQMLLQRTHNRREWGETASSGDRGEGEEEQLPFCSFLASFNLRQK